MTTTLARGASTRMAKKKEPPKQTFGEKLKALREQNGLSQYALAKLAGIQQNTLSRYEANERQPTWESVQRICMALGADCSELYDDTIEIPEDVELRERGRPAKEGDGTEAE